MIGASRSLSGYGAKTATVIGPDQDGLAGFTREGLRADFFETHFQTGGKPDFELGGSLAWHCDQAWTVDQAEASWQAEWPPGAQFRVALASVGALRRRVPSLLEVAL